MTNAPTWLTPHERHERAITRAVIVAGALTAALMGLIILIAVASGGSLKLVVTLMAGVALLPMIWRRPQLAVYLLLAAALVAEEQDLRFSLFDSLSLFTDLQSSAGLRGVAVNPVELLAVLGVAVTLLKARGASSSRLTAGPLIAPFAVLITMLVYGVLRGHMAGGDLKIALWGIRGLNLTFLAYLLTANLVRERSQVRLLFLILSAGIALKSLIALSRFVFTFHGSFGAISGASGGAVDSLVAHEDSFFFLVAIFLCVIAFALKLPKLERRVSLVGLLLALVPLVANQRRAAIAAALLMAIVLVVLLLHLRLLRPRSLVAATFLALLVLPAYGVAGWNSTSLLAMPVQAVKSGFQPDARDASSNGYREIENTNLRATTKQSHCLGVGFGVPMTQVETMPDIRLVYAWYLYLPHNGILWLAMTMGVAGLAAFTYLLASAIRLAVAGLKMHTDPHMRALCLLAVLSLAAYVTIALLDQGLVSQRIGVFMGVQLGLLGLAFDASKPDHERASAPARTTAVTIATRGGFYVRREVRENTHANRR